MQQLLKKHETKVRFLLVGGTNTVLDFALLFLFTNLGLNRVVANIASTGIAFIFSFFANRKFTFKDSSKNVRRQFLVFAAVTLSGLWILQPIIILITTSFLDDVMSNNASLFVAKVIATGASLIWNYLLYSRLVFKKEEGK
jgi:putative flippase GtrA